MKQRAILQKLKDLHTRFTFDEYVRHGAKGKIYGVPRGRLRALFREIVSLPMYKKDVQCRYGLSQALWNTKILDAQFLALLLVPPHLMTQRLLNAWVHDINCQDLAEEFAHFVSKTPFARKKAEEWNKSHRDYIGFVGWLLVAKLAHLDGSLSDSYFLQLLAVIERTIHVREPIVRLSMHDALIAIGRRNSVLKMQALSVAKTIGRIEVEYRGKHKQAPDAARAIRRQRARKHAVG